MPFKPKLPRLPKRRSSKSISQQSGQISPGGMPHHHHNMHGAVPEKDPLSGHPGHLDITQQHYLKKMRDTLLQEGWIVPLEKSENGDVVTFIAAGTQQGHTHVFDDATLLRFLRARKFDLQKSLSMFTEYLKWRKEYGTDELYETFEYTEEEKTKVNDIYPRFYHKTDKDGRPLYIERLGKIDLNEMWKSTTPERQIQSLVVEYEKLLRDRLPVCSMGRPEPVSTSCTIMDIGGLSLNQMFAVKSEVQKASAIASDRYPETMGHLYVINVPWGFSTVWTLVKGWLDEATVKKIHILGHDWKNTVFQQVDPKNIPKELGGECECPEGCGNSDAGPWRDHREGNLVLPNGNAHHTTAGTEQEKEKIGVSENGLGPLPSNGAHHAVA